MYRCFSAENNKARLRQNMQRTIAIMTDVNYCVVGAGFAGLTAALRLNQAGESVALREARDRVGGRTFTEVRDDGVWIDRGGAWIGPGQDRIKALMTEYGAPSYKQYTGGKAMMVVDGKQWSLVQWCVVETEV